MPEEVVCHYCRVLSVEAARRTEDGEESAILYLDMDDAPKPGTLRLAVPLCDLPDLIEQLEAVRDAFAED